MESELSVLACFLVGLMSTLHCFGMCGGISTLLTMQTRNQNDHRAKFKIALIYNFGRIFSYSVIGLLAGLTSELGVNVFFQGGHTYLQFLSSIVLIIIALNILGWLSFFSHLEKITYAIWKPFQELLKWILPAKSVFDYFCLGLIWGWLPCGMVYSVLMLAIVSGDAIQSMLYMFAFGIGTLPGMVTTSVGGSFLKNSFNKPVFKYFSALLLIVIALLPITGFWNGDHSDHSHHHHHH